jgi:hypothetical protein
VHYGHVPGSTGSSCSTTRATWASIASSVWIWAARNHRSADISELQSRTGDELAGHAALSQDDPLRARSRTENTVRYVFVERVRETLALDETLLADRAGRFWRRGEEIDVAVFAAERVALPVEIWANPRDRDHQVAATDSGSSAIYFPSAQRAGKAQRPRKSCR